MAEKDEMIGYHKGALTTLAKEREEFKRLLGIVEQLMHYHLGELKKMGVELSSADDKDSESQSKGKSKGASAKKGKK